jgi:NAD/NADP transhydrogenase beta subunit
MIGLRLPDEGVDGGGMSILVAGVSLACCVLLAAGLWRTRNRASLAGPASGGAGLLLAIGAALYVHDAMALPEIVAALSIGGGAGYLLGRQVRRIALPRLGVAVQGLTGVTTLLTAGAAWIDPAALGLSGDWRVAGHACLIVALAAGAVGTAGAVFQAGAARIGPRVPFLLAAANGWAGAAFGFAFGNPALILAGGLLGAAASRLAAGAAVSTRGAAPTGE